jgi:hypothetical protein
MSISSGKAKLKFEEFKKEAKIVTLVSRETGKKKKIVKWREKTFNIADLHIVFELVKKEM